jgi:heptose I phosphotransferase
VYLTLNAALKKYFRLNDNLFEYLMGLRGEVYRQVEGRRTQRIFFAKQPYFLKQHFGVGWREIFKNLMQLRLPVLSAKNEWQAVQHLNALAIPTVTIAGYGYRGMNPARLQSFLLTDELTQVISLEDLCQDWARTPPNPVFKRVLIREVARMARNMHNGGMNHRDFYICHFLWDTTSPLVAPRLYLIDLHRAQIRRQVPKRWLIKDLAGIYFSSKDIGLTARDLWRFIAEYRQQPLRTVLRREKHFWQKVKQRGDKMYRQHGK